MQKLIKQLASLKITVTCLSLLFFLTFWGTLYQVNYGLFEAQAKIFNSYWFLLFNFIPFPGAQSVIWVLFVNLLAATYVFFIHYKFKKIGILLIHYGMLIYCIAAFVVFHGTTESHLALLEGAGANVSNAYHKWELSIWKNEVVEGDEIKRNVLAIDASLFKKGAVIELVEFPLKIKIEKYLTNADAYLKAPEGIESNFLNQSSIKFINEKKNEIEPEKNIPGILFRVFADNTPEIPLLLYGLENSPTQIFANGQIYNIQLRRKNYELPFVLTLKDFTKEVHPGTNTPSAFKSLVEIDTQAGKREVLIYMNHPLRYKNYTLYQASYALDSLGREYSTLAVVKNAGWVLPYLASGIVFLGLSIHFLGYGIRWSNRK